MISLLQVGNFNFLKIVNIENGNFMRTAIRKLPSNYTLSATIDLAKNMRLMLILNLVGLALFFLIGWLLLFLARLLRPSQPAEFSLHFTLLKVLGLLLVYAFTLILHELVHGLFFWLLTGERPIFGLRQLYAFAGAPDWYLPRNWFLLVGLAPLVLITFFGAWLLIYIPIPAILYLIFALATNISGALGDVYVVVWLLFLPSSILVRDQGDIFSIYHVQEAGI